MEPPGNDVVTLESAEKTILRWDSTSSEQARDQMIFESDREDIDRYLHAVDELQKSTNSNNTLQIAMTRLEDEFRNLLVTHTSPIDTELLTTEETPYADDEDEDEGADEADKAADEADVEAADDDDDVRSLTKKLEYQDSGSSNYRSSTSIREIDLIPSDIIYDLRNIAERMISNGYQRECVQAYSSARKSSVESSFKKLGIEKLSIGDVQKLDWETLETKIRRWIRAAKVCVRMLFASEKRLIEQIFYDLGTNNLVDSCFMETIKGHAIQLFNFAEAISISKRAPEKLFKMLDLHDGLSDLIPDIEIVFDLKSLENVRVQGIEILSRIGEAVRGILSEFENKVVNEPSRVPVPGGTIHPLTRFVMNYISLISDYKQTLIELINSKPVPSGDDPNGPIMPDEVDGRSNLSLHLIWIIVILQYNLEGKSNCYRDGSLAHLFMMNNVHYIVQKAKASPELRELIGDAFLKKLAGKYRVAATNYQRSTWVKVLHCLRDEGLHVSGSFSSGVSKSALRERFKTFNAMFDEVHKTQAMWLVPDSQLREELRISISDLLVPAYRSFLGRFRIHIENGRHPEYYIKYSVDELEASVVDFFEGYPVSQSLRRRLSH